MIPFILGAALFGVCVAAVFTYWDEIVSWFQDHLKRIGKWFMKNEADVRYFVKELGAFYGYEYEFEIWTDVFYEKLGDWYKLEFPQATKIDPSQVPTDILQASCSETRDITRGMMAYANY